MKVIEVRDSESRRELRKRMKDQPPQYFQDNIFGLILCEHESGQIIPIICGHGGSGWLCRECGLKALSANAPKPQPTNPS
jgi:hypothetical protein